MDSNEEEDKVVENEATEEDGERTPSKSDTTTKSDTKEDSSEDGTIRETGQLPLSIGTSLAIESLLGIHPEIQVSKPPIHSYQEIWINLRTLMRNMVSAYPSDSRLNLQTDDLFSDLVDEINFLSLELSQLKVVFYVSELNLEKKYQHARIRYPHTDIQKLVDKLMMVPIQAFNKAYKETNKDNLPYEYYLFSDKPDKTKRLKAVMLTHIALDLCSHGNFKELVLLESHTGKLKTKAEWYTKYAGSKDLSRIPFTEKFLQVFGDKELFKPLDNKLREDILAVADKYNWTSVTTKDKINYGIATLKNHFFIDFIRKL